MDNKLAISRFFALTGAPVDSYCGDKESFLGRYHGYHNPVGVENGKLSGEMCYNENGCGALAAQMLLKPGETKEIAFLVGMKEHEEADTASKESSEPRSAKSASSTVFHTKWSAVYTNFPDKRHTCLPLFF